MHSAEEMSVSEKKEFLEKLMKEGFNNTPFDELSDEEQAVDTVYVAMQEDDEEKAYEFIDYALSLDTKCELAYEALGDLADNQHVAGACFKMGADIGLRKYLSKEDHAENNESVEVGMFYSMFETRPTIRCLYKYGDTLLGAGNYDDALEVFKEVLRLNTSDNMGARYALLHLLIGNEEKEEFLRCYKKYKDDSSTQMKYAHLLFLYVFERENTKAIEKAKKEALESSKYIPKLLAKRQEDGSLHGAYAMGSKEEADMYDFMFGQFWEEVDGAIEMLNAK